MFCFKIMKLTYLYRTRIKSTRLETLAAALAGLALSHTISKAILTGMFSSEMPFFRTPKGGNRPALINALSAATEETGITVLLWMVSAGVVLCQPYENASAKLWSMVLLIQSLPYLATLIVSLTNALPMRKAGKPLSAPTGQIPLKSDT